MENNIFTFMYIYKEEITHDLNIHIFEKYAKLFLEKFF